MAERTARPARPAKPNRHARRAANAQVKENAISNETLEDLKELKQNVDLAQAEAQSAASDFQIAIAREFHKLKVPIQESAVCLLCGTVRPRIIEECPTCENEVE